jgi:micrococcal nuclease
VIDGDTVIVEFAGGAKEIVRLLGVDTPETVDPNRPAQCFGAEASTYVAMLIPPGTEVRLERDVEARDHFGRLLAYIYRRSDGLFINRDLLRLGFADLSIYPPNDTYAIDLQTVTTSARTQALGLWGACGGPDVPLDPPMR